MNIKKIVKIFNILLTATFLLTVNCNKRNADLDPDRPLSAKEKREKNLAEGRGASLGDLIGNRGSTNYEFSTSNPLWRASLETLDFFIR